MLAFPNRILTSSTIVDFFPASMNIKNRIVVGIRNRYVPQRVDSEIMSRYNPIFLTLSDSHPVSSPSLTIYEHIKRK